MSDNTSNEKETPSYKTNTTLSPIKNRADYNYVRTVPTFVCNSVSGLSEIGRWVMDLNEIVRAEESHAPQLCIKKLNKLTNTDETGDNPVLIHTDSLIYTPSSIIQYYDQQNPSDKRLFPEDKTRRQEVIDLFNWFTTDLNRNIWGYLYAEMFTSKKKTKALLKKGVSFWERLKITFTYGSIKRGLMKQWNMAGKDSVVFLVEVLKIFKTVSDRLEENNTKYLVGDTITAADIAFVSIAAPIILPEEFGGSITKFNETTEEIRQEILKIRGTKAGQFVLKLYQEDRPINLNLPSVPKKKGLIGKLFNRIGASVSNGQYKIYYFLQKRFPVLRIGLAKIAIVSRHSLVVNVIERNQDFTIKEINANKMAQQSGAFFLGMDKPNPQMTRERDFAKAASRGMADVERAQLFIRKRANELCNGMKPYGKMDVVQSLTYPVLISFLDDYFGVPAPTNARMNKWQRVMFFDLFLNLTNNKEKHQLAVNSGKERIPWVRQIIRERRAKLEAGETIGDSLLNRMIIMQQNKVKGKDYSWVDDDVIRRNIGGLLTGISEGTNKAVIHVLQELFKRPVRLKEAIKIAKSIDETTIYKEHPLLGYAMEALRFNPVQPGILRFAESEQLLPRGNGKTYKIKANRKVIALTSGAMFDKNAFENPKEFNPNRKSRYMNWGFGLHECYGGYINQVSIPEIVGAVLRLNNVKNAKGPLGKAYGLADGPFPNNYLVTFEA